MRRIATQSKNTGTETENHLLRAATDKDSLATIVSVDGIGAYDIMRRQAMLSKLYTLPKAKKMSLPFVMMSYGQHSQYL